MLRWERQADFWTDFHGPTPVQGNAPVTGSLVRPPGWGGPSTARMLSSRASPASKSLNSDDYRLYRL
jgi:hypothetical protein